MCHAMPLPCAVMVTGTCVTGVGLNKRPARSRGWASSVRFLGTRRVADVSRPTRIHETRFCVVATASSVPVLREEGVTMLTTKDELTAFLRAAADGKRKCVLNISSSKCGPCKLLLPTLIAYAEKFPNARFARFYFDKDDSLRDIVNTWAVQGVPSYRLYDEQGEMTKQFATGTPTKLGNSLYLFLS